MLPGMKRKPRLTIRHIIRDVIIAAGVCGAVVVAYLLGSFDGRLSRRAMLTLPSPQQNAAVLHASPPAPVATPAVPPRASSAVPQWQRNAARTSITSGQPVIVLVIDDMGLD